MQTSTATPTVHILYMQLYSAYNSAASCITIQLAELLFIRIYCPAHVAGLVTPVSFVAVLYTGVDSDSSEHVLSAPVP